jgi:hypothetical protein
MKDFFKKYPEAKPLWKVGDKHFLNHARHQADVYANTMGLQVEIVEPPSRKKKVADAAE